MFEISPSKNILIVYDFDGVMTDNRVIVSEDGIESVIVNRSDGLAVSILKELGFEQLIVTTETNKVVIARANKLKIPILDGINDKKETVTLYCKEKNISLKDIIYIGNDINDLEIMKSVGYPVCPADAYPEIKQISFVLNTNGGYGVIRELLNYVIKNEVNNH